MFSLLTDSYLVPALTSLTHFTLPFTNILYWANNLNTDSIFSGMWGILSFLIDMSRNHYSKDIFVPKRSDKYEQLQSATIENTAKSLIETARKLRIWFRCKDSIGGLEKLNQQDLVFSVKLQLLVLFWKMLVGILVVVVVVVLAVGVFLVVAKQSLNLNSNFLSVDLSLDLLI